MGHGVGHGWGTSRAQVGHGWGTGGARVGHRWGTGGARGGDLGMACHGNRYLIATWIYFWGLVNEITEKSLISMVFLISESVIIIRVLGLI